MIVGGGGGVGEGGSIGDSDEEEGGVWRLLLGGWRWGEGEEKVKGSVALVSGWLDGTKWIEHAL